ncbi:MAG TPA: hypothetical protein P5244_08945 [Syntrophales bacterium]|nr:hypothetical protein [Syntrophales bacterium]
MANSFAPRVTRIKGLSDRRRLPRLGIIRLGLKARSAKSGREYPVEVPYFICPPEVQKIYGEQPTELDVMLPTNNIDEIFPCAYKYYGSSKGLKCQGDGEKAWRVNETTNEMEQVECPCQFLEEGKCKQTGMLMVMLPKVSVGGIYQVRTSSYNSIVDINSGLDYVSALVGRFALVPLKLRRVKTETHHDDKKQSHYTLQIIFDADIQTLNTLRSDTIRVLEHPRYQLPAPLDENPESAPVDMVVDVDDEERQAEEDIPFVSDEDPPQKTSAANEPEYITEAMKRAIEDFIKRAKLDREMVKEFFLYHECIGLNDEGEPTLTKLHKKVGLRMINDQDAFLKSFMKWMEGNNAEKE